jgi:hypothetical protein
MFHTIAGIYIKDLSRAVAHQGLRSVDAIKRLASGMSLASRYEVRPAFGDGWMITQRGSSLPLRIFKKKADAVREAKKLAKDSHAELNVFQRNGRVQSRLLFT